MIKLGLMFANSGPCAQPEMLAHLARTTELEIRNICFEES
jgi:hypothetical protein